MNGFQSWLAQLNYDMIIQYGLIILASLVAIIFHEVAHGLTALWLGDPTAKNAGRLTLNPIRHVDIWGLLMMAVFRFGWAKPVPVDMRYFKHPVRDMAITAAAGPVSNVILAWIALLLRSVTIYISLRTGSAAASVLSVFLMYVAILSVGLAVFNILPISPLDGSKVLYALLPQRIYYRILKYERYGFIVLMVLLFSGILDTPLNFLRSGLISILSAVSDFPYTILQSLIG